MGGGLGWVAVYGLSRLGRGTRSLSSDCDGRCEFDGGVGANLDFDTTRWGLLLHLLVWWWCVVLLMLLVGILTYLKSHILLLRLASYSDVVMVVVVVHTIAIENRGRPVVHAPLARVATLGVLRGALLPHRQSIGIVGLLLLTATRPTNHHFASVCISSWSSHGCWLWGGVVFVGGHR